MGSETYRRLSVLFFLDTLRFPTTPTSVWQYGRGPNAFSCDLLSPVVNTPPAEAGGFRLRLEAGSVRRPAYGVQNKNLCGSYRITGTAEHVNQLNRISVLKRINAIFNPMPAKAVGFTDPLSGTLNPQWRCLGFCFRACVWRFASFSERSSF